MDNELQYFTERVDRLRAEVGKVIVGQRAVVDAVMACMFADGHALLEGVPGLGKTLLVRTLASAMSLAYRRIQFTPDLMPADIIGTHILTEEPGKGRQMTFREGPLFTQFLLADEINRATPKTQSAMLEAMAERQVTVSGHRRPLPDPFFVMATQNPLEQEGTYPLPEAQLDRFFYKIVVPFPTLDDLVTVVDRTTGNKSQESAPVIQPDELAQMRRIVRDVPIAPEVIRYAMRLVLATQTESEHCVETTRKYIRYGASPRGAQTLILGAKVSALMQKRHHVTIADIRAVAPPALRHRLGRNFDAEAEGLSTDQLVMKVLDEVPEAEGRVKKELSA